MRVVTTFANRHWDELASRMVHGVVKHWPWAEFHVYVNGGVPPQLYRLPLTAHDHYRDQPELKGFIDHNQEKTNFLVWDEGRYEFKFDACRFAHKVYALHHQETMYWKGDLIWLDADVLTKKDVPLLTFLDRNKDAAYLGREGYPPECGFMWFNRSRMGGDIIRAVHRYYQTGKIFDEAEWHDSYLFGKVFPNYDCQNLTEGVQGKHVWPESPIGKFCDHLKGPARKRAGEDLPDSVALSEPEQVTQPI